MPAKIKTSLSLDEGLVDEARSLGIVNPSAWVNEALKQAVALRREVAAGVVIKDGVSYSPAIYVRAHIDFVAECTALEGVDDWRQLLLANSQARVAQLLDTGGVVLGFDIPSLDEQLISYEVACDERVLHVHPTSYEEDT